MNNTSFFANQQIGIIGYGLFGKFLCDELFKGFDINVYSPRFVADTNKPNLKQASSLKEIAENSDFIIPCVPISKFEDVIRDLKPYLRENSIIMDVCSVKVYPVEVMKKYLEANSQIISSHPLFGPKPFEKRKTLEGSKMVMNNISAAQNIFDQVAQFFKSMSIEVIEMDEESHDRLMAQSQFFTQMIRHSAKTQGLRATTIDTPASALLFEAFENIGTSEKLLIDMLKYNNYCLDVLDNTLGSLTELKIQAKRSVNYE